MSTMNMSTKYESHVACTNQKTTNIRVWDGRLQLNSTLTVSTVAFFKSGEKMPNVKWTEFVEVKGKVKLHDFEGYIKDLTRSPNRGLMIVSLYRKEGSSKLRWEEIKKVAKKYVEDGRVGIAKVITGVDLYVCHCCDKILTLLAKYGFLKFNDKTTIDENKDYLIGCVVWKKNLINHPNSFHQNSSIESSSKSVSIEVWSPIRTPLESSTKYFPSHNDVRTEKEKNVSNIIPQESYKKYLSYYSDLIRSEETPTVLPFISTKLETSNPNPSLTPAVRYVLECDVTTVAKQSSPVAILQKEQVLSEFDFGTSTTSHQNFDKRMMEEDMDISPQKKSCSIDDNDNMSKLFPTVIKDMQNNNHPIFSVASSSNHPLNVGWSSSYTYLNQLANKTKNMPNIQSLKPNFTPLPQTTQIHPPVLIPKNDFTYLSPNLMREQVHSHAPINPKPDFTYLGPILMREQAHAHEKTRSDVSIGNVLTFSRDNAINSNQQFNSKYNLLPPK